MKLGFFILMILIIIFNFRIFSLIQIKLEKICEWDQFQLIISDYIIAQDISLFGE